MWSVKARLQVEMPGLRVEEMMGQKRKIRVQ